MGRNINGIDWDIVVYELKYNGYDVIQANSGGHKCITNISGLNYYGRSRRKPRSKGGYDRGEDDAPYVALTKNIQKKFVDLLKREINTKS